MRFRPLLRREDCSSGTQYYTCASNGFSGCCSVDACDYSDGCPDSSKSASVAISTSSESTSPSAVTTIAVSTTSSETSVASFFSTTALPYPSPFSSSVSDPAPTLPTSSTAGTTHTAASETSRVAFSTPSTDAGSGSTPPPAAISKGAIAGIVTAGLLAFILLAAFLIWRQCWRRPLGQKPEQPKQPKQPKQPAAGVLEKGPDNSESGTVASPQTTGPVDNSTSSLFGEVSAVPGTLEAALARWGLHGARLAALRHKRMRGSLRSRNDIADLGSYLGPVAGTPGQTDSSAARLAELDAQGPAVLAELESQPTSYWALSQHPPAMSASSGGRTPATTFVSSWRSSSTGSAAGMLGPDIVTPELDSTPRMEIMEMPAPPAGTDNKGLPSRAPPTDWPRATLDVTLKEQTHGLHVGSWASYRP